MNNQRFADFDPEFWPLFKKCRPATMTSPERLYALYKAVRHVTQARIAGAFVECGVWRGGSVMMMAETLKLEGKPDRTLFLYDTFEGMTEPTPADVDLRGVVAQDLLAQQPRGRESYDWAYAPKDEVERNLRSTTYPPHLFHLVQGKVEDTIPGMIPDKIALLRLDTDWYESTRHELVHLFPRLERGGVLVIDDYGHWKGSRRAVDEYFSGDGPRILLNRVDYTGRIGVKL